MTRPFLRILSLALAAAAGACAAAGAADPATQPVRVLGTPHSGPVERPLSAADVHFMTGMIPHHAQAVRMAGMAATHGASPSIRVLSERIVVAQRDEIETMRSWLADRGQPVPAADATHMTMTMNGMRHDMLMPGMLTDAQLAELDAARGAEFDRLLLTYMIQHHQGAVAMVDELLTSYGGAQDDVVYKVASDIYADQTTEIERMQRMLAAMPAGNGPR